MAVLTFTAWPVNASEGAEMCARVSPSIRTGILGSNAVVEATRERQNPESEHSCERIVATTAHELASLRDDWLYLRNQHRCAAPDSDPDFFLRVLSDLGGESRPHVVIFYRAGKPCCGILGRYARVRIVSKLGYVRFKSPRLRTLTVVYGGFLSDGSPSSHGAIHEYCQGLLREGIVDALIFHHLGMDDEVANALIQNLRRKINVVSHHEVRWVLDLIDPQTQERIVVNSSKTRSTFRRKDRKFVEHFGGAVELRRFQDSAEVDEFIRIADQVTARTYQAALATGVQDTERWRTVLTALAEGNHFRGYVLSGGKEPIAYIAGSVLQQQFTLFATGFLPAYRKLSPGTVLLNRCFDTLASNGVVLFDFGSLFAAYKRLHATRTLEERTVHVYGVGWRAIVARCIEQTTLSAYTWLKKAAASLGVLDGIKRRWRRRLEGAHLERNHAEQV